MPAKAPDFRLNGHTIAGIVDAEAHFAITENNGGGSMSCWMAIALRDDDIGLLHALARETRLGVVRRMRYPLRSRRRQDFGVWNAAVELWCGSAQNRVERMHELRQSIREARRYVPTAADEQTVPRETAGFDDWLGGFVAGDGHLGIVGGAVRLTLKLRADEAPVLAWIRDCTGMGNICGPYGNRAAHPSLAWNVTRAADLLVLADRLDGRVPIAAMKRCADALGRFPGPTEYARWRLHNDPGAPSFGTAYRLFPGGRGELKAACAASA